MSRTWLILDANYLCWRAFFALPSFDYDGIKTQVLFGFFKDILYLKEYFRTNRFVFCFDTSGSSKRRELSPGYKMGRQKKYDELDDERKQAQAEMRRQVQMLEGHYLPAIGFRNIFSQPGYEADDMVAVACSQLPKGDEAVIVSSDQDLFQLLRPGVVIWNPVKKQIFDKRWFVETYGIEPSAWIDVKAIAGCSSDDVEGVAGVGEKTAIKFLVGSLKPESKAYQSIVLGNSQWRENLPLVTLPFPGASVPDLRRDDVSRDTWNGTMARLGMETIMRT